MFQLKRHTPTLIESETARIELLPEGVVYLLINHDEKVAPDDVRPILHCIHALSDVQRPLLLIDCQRRYGLPFAAQEILWRCGRFRAVAYWIRRPISRVVAQHAIDTYFKGAVEVFPRRAPAVRWLTSFLPTKPKVPCGALPAETGVVPIGAAHAMSGIPTASAVSIALPDDTSGDARYDARPPPSSHELIHFYGQWAARARRAVRAAIEGVEPTLGLGRPTDSFFPAPWLASAEHFPSRGGTLDLRYTVYRAGHGRVLTAPSLKDIYAQIRGLAAPG